MQKILKPVSSIDNKPIESLLRIEYDLKTLWHRITKTSDKVLKAQLLNQYRSLHLNYKKTRVILLGE